jgi:hypothetical protein
MRRRKQRRNDLRFERLEPKQLLASIVIAPIDAELLSDSGSYLQYGTNGSHWLDGSGLADPTIVESGDPVPNDWPEHISGNSSERVSRIRDAVEINTLTLDLGGTFDVTGMALWNSTEEASGGVLQTDRGFENTRLSYSIDGGITFTGSDLLTWTERSSDASTNQGSNPPPPVATFAPEIQMLPGAITDVTHIRMDVDNFSGESIVMASEFRFIGESAPSASVADLSAETLEDEYSFTQGVEGERAIEFVVTLSEPNLTGVPITFDLQDLGTGTATSGSDYEAIAANAQIVVADGATTGTLVVNVFEDFLIEATELVNVQISNPSSSLVTIGESTAVGTIGDNDTAGVTIIGADDLAISEDGSTDTYTIALDTIPTGVVEITATADLQTRISSDGVNFAQTLTLNFADMTPQTITVLAADDQTVENTHTGTVTHAISGAVVDPNYPDVTVESLYTRTGPPDPTFQELIDSGTLPTGFNSTTGVTGSTIDVNNAVLEAGLPANASIPQDIKIHTLANSTIQRNFFDRWTRWYQEDGATQVFRVFEGEENVRNDRALAARIEAFSTGWEKGVWNDFSARYTVLKPQSMSLFQAYQLGVEWSVHVGMTDDGDINFSHRRNYDGGETRFVLAEDMIGKSFEILIRDNGHEYEVYFNGELKGKGYWERPNDDFQFRWGAYRGAREMTQDALVFVNGVEMQANTSAPVGLAPYRLPTTSLSIESVTAEITDNDDGVQRPFIEQTVQDAARVLAEEFDLGGPQVAYHDTTDGNRGNQARPYEDADLFAGSIVLSDIADGEWLEFTRDVVPGIYDIDVRAWSNNSNTKGVRLLVATDSSSQTFTELGSVDVPNTNNERISHTIEDVDLTAWAGDDRVFRVEFFGNNFSYDWFEFDSLAEPSSVIKRGVTYGGATATYGEDAIDESKSPYQFLPGTTATFANYTNHSSGLNRVFVDLLNSQAASLTNSDFEFRIGNTNDPDNWTLVDGSNGIALPTIINGTRDSSTGIQRFTLVWADHAIANTWLQVRVFGNTNTGLTNDDVFYFGNAVGETGNNPTDAIVNLQDVGLTRSNQTGFGSAAIDNSFDFNRDGRVNLIDVAIARSNQSGFSPLLLLSAPDGENNRGNSFSTDGKTDSRKNESSRGRVYTIPATEFVINDDVSKLSQQEAMHHRRRLDNAFANLTNQSLQLAGAIDSRS